MLTVLSIEQIRKMDSFAINKLNAPSIVLMENASINILHEIIDNTPEIENAQSFAIICGKGNNAGDGFALARHLLNYSFNVSVFHLYNESELSKDALINFSILKNIQNKNLKMIYLKVNNISKIKKYDVVIDAVLGSGTSGVLKEPLAGIIKKINKYDNYRIAIDIPTGLDAEKGTGDIIFNADKTITISSLKRGFFVNKGVAALNNVTVVPMGFETLYNENIENDLLLVEPSDVMQGIPKKKKDINKYSAGKVLVIAGSEKYPGAAALTSKAAFKSGAGSVILAFPNKFKNVLFNELAEIVIEPYGKNSFLDTEGYNNLAERIKWSETIIIGPGLGRSEETADAVVKLLNETNNKHVVVDADAIHAINKKYAKVNLKNKVLTPHHKEFSDLLGISLEELYTDLYSFGKEFVKKTGSYLVLKGPATIMFYPDGKAYIDPTGNPGLAKFGSGDVLAGIIGGFIAQNKKLEDSIISAVYLHSLTADLLKRNFSEISYTPLDLIAHFPNSIKYMNELR